jgi:hypothetical protein
VNGNRNGGRCLKYDKRDRAVKAYPKPCFNGVDTKIPHSDGKDRKNRNRKSKQRGIFGKQRITVDRQRNYYRI